jgi:pyruvate, water dikinase
VTHTRLLRELRAADADLFGAKSAVLGELIAAEIPVPPGFAVSTTAFRAFVDGAGLGDAIASALGRIALDDVDSVGAGSRSIGEAMRSAPMPAEVRDEIVGAYAALGEDVPVAVRSSALGEDSQDATFAGQQETYLWVRGADRVCDAVRDCWVSLYSPPAIAYRSRLGTTDAAMGVTVQLMVDAEVSGVLFTCNPVSGDPSMVAVNASWGLGLAVVGGEVTPDDYLVSKVTREVVREHVHSKEIEYVPRDRGAVRVEVPAERRDVACLGPAALEELVDLARVVERYFGSHQDVEWAFARGGGLHVLQSRPVTAMRAVEAPKETSAMALVMNAFGARPKE